MPTITHQHLRRIHLETQIPTRAAMLHQIPLDPMPLTKTTMPRNRIHLANSNLRSLKAPLVKQQKPTRLLLRTRRQINKPAIHSVRMPKTKPTVPLEEMPPIPSTKGRRSSSKTHSEQPASHSKQQLLQQAAEIHTPPEAQNNTHPLKATRQRIWTGP